VYNYFYLEEIPMNLRDVISLYNGTEDEILEQVQNYKEIQGKLVSSEVVTMYLIKHDLYSSFMNSDNPLCLATMNTIYSLGEFNFIMGTVKGEMNLQMLDLLISQGLASEELKTDLISEANSEAIPWENETIYDIWQVTRTPSWILLGTITNNRRSDIKIRAQLTYSEDALTRGVGSLDIKMLGRLPSGSRYTLIPDMSTIKTLDVSEPTVFVDITLPFDRLIQEYEVQIRPDWEGFLQEVQYLGIAL